MKNRYSVILVVVGLFLSSPAVAINNSAVNNPAVGSNVRLNTTPVSNIRSGLVRNLNPIDTSGNLVVTGNVGGGRHFRGLVPYRATTDFTGQLGSTEIDPFLRRWSGTSGLTPFSRKPAPFYSSSGTVSSFIPGYSEVFRPPQTISTARGFNEFARRQPLYIKPRLLSDTVVGRHGELIENALRPPTSYRGRPMAMDTEQLERVIIREIDRYSKDEQVDVYGTKDAQEVEDAKRDEPEEERRVQEESLNLPIKPEARPDSLKPFEPQEFVAKPGEPKADESKEPEEQVPDEYRQADVYELMKGQIEKLQQELEELRIAEQAEAGKEKPEEISDEEKMGLRKYSRKEQARKERLSDKPKEIEAIDAEEFLAQHKTFASYSKDKFNQYLRAGEVYLKQGRYYRAADAYGLASIYKPGDPLAYAGKSHALFAAGEYMSSALFLSRALRIFPEYAQFKIDIVAMVGDRDKLESRIEDVEYLLGLGATSELDFLLGYVYYQMGRIDKAQTHIEAAYEDMPDEPAVVALKKAIERATK